ncbi:dicarboxylate/amino acid:cation symporter [Garciella nitratireducens]|uniref:dicarboxylate/amino acid:cation symporter n=1 Tax=Garciella nitratireducens TaxID=218205 RepID=UPI000E07B842|nr:dicarboxylate/amino acid:cation symporter [Garciella nitratireducens]RBP36410.1 Na+/H+-dicarboxylate symporter [Garciella nitratireducens]
MSTQNKNKMSSTKQIMLALLFGLIIGLLLHYILGEGWLRDTVLVDGLFYFIGQGFVRLLQMLVVPLVFFSISSGAMAMGDTGKFGRVAIRTIVLYMLTTAIAIVIALVLSNVIQPGIGMDLAATEDVAAQTEVQAEAPSLIDTLLNIIPTNPFNALSTGNMLQVIFWAFVVGIICSKFPKEMKLLENIVQVGNDFMMKVTAMVMKLAPIGVFGLIARTFTEVGLGIVGPLLKLLINIVGSMVIMVLVVYLILILFVARVRPSRFFKKVLPVYTFAFSSASSSATIPLTLKSCDTLGVPREISSFTIPLGATINMNGTAIFQGCAVVFIAGAYGVNLTIIDLVTVVLTAVLSSIGTAGVPGSGMIMLSMVLQSAGLPIEGIGLIMSIERIIDMFRTALNVTGDVVATFISAAKEKMIDYDCYYSDNIVSMDGES